MKKIKLNKEVTCSEIPFWKTDKSEMYKAVIDVTTEDTEENGLFYAVKMSRNSTNYLENTLMKEMKITHLIENLSPQSVIIPILMVCGERKNSYAIMQLKKNGEFLNELHHNLEIKYGAGRVTVKYQLMLISKILAALQYVHHCTEEKGFLHLDIQPCNIFIENTDEEKMEFGTVKFIDFESAQLVEVNQYRKSDAEVQTIHYTTGFTAPEIFEEGLYAAEYSADIFSVSAVLYWMLTGKKYRFVDDIEEIKIPEASVLTYQLKKVLKCGLEYNKAYRYSDVQSMKKAIDQLIVWEEAYEKYDFFNLLSVAYINWVPQEEVLTDGINFNADAFHSSVMRLSDSLMKNGIDFRKCDYIFSGLWKIKERYCSEISGRDICSLISDGISLSSHLGDSGRGIMLSEELEKYRNEISVIEYTQIVNRIAVIYADHYDFKKAYLCIKNHVAALELLKETYVKMSEAYQMDTKKPAAVYDLARAYSAMGCYLTLLHEGDPMLYFEKAIKEFDWQAGNISITWSHILHYAIQSEDGRGYGKSLYEHYSNAFFENECGIIKRYKIARNALIHKYRPNPYPMWIFMKGILYFYPETFEGILRDEILRDFYEGIYEGYHAFPMLLIYRYVALLEYGRNGRQITKIVFEAFQKSLVCCEEAVMNIDMPLNILMCINYVTQSIWNDISGNGECNRELLKAMQCHAEKYGWTCLAEKIQNNQSFQNLLEFEYC